MNGLIEVTDLNTETQGIVKRCLHSLSPRFIGIDISGGRITAIDKDQGVYYQHDVLLCPSHFGRTKKNLPLF